MNSTVKTILRPQCVLTDIEDLSLIYSFRNFPIYVGCTETDSSSDLFADMDWGYSKNSGSVQLISLLDPDILYKQNHGSGTIGNIWQQHHKKFFNFISKTDVKNVLEIGGASGSLASHFLNSDKNFHWTIAEPSDAFNMKDSRITFVNDFFENLNEDQKFNTVVHSHVFEHAYDPIKFLTKIYNILEHGGDHFITIPNMKHWLEQGFTNTLLFEHTFYVDANVLEYMLNKTNFEVVDKIIEEHSIFIHCKKSKDVKTKNPKFDYVKDLYLNYVNKIEKDLKSIMDQIKDSKVFLFGGHIFSQILVNLGLPENQIISILDNDPKKHNKRLYGTNLYVQTPMCLKNIDDPIVILRGGVYTKEISESLLSINPRTRII